MVEVARNLELLRMGQPPEDAQWLTAMTVGREWWLDRFRDHYLGNYIRNGGSKVKVLVGSEGSGKTHLLRCAAEDAKELGYTVVFLDLRRLPWKLSNIVELYKAVAACLDREGLVRGLCLRVADHLGYNAGEYNGSSSIVPLLVEREGLSPREAHRELRKAAMQALLGSDLSLPFRTLAYTLVSARMGDDYQGDLDPCWKWLAGEKLDPAERKRSRLYERLTKANGRVWLYALIRLLRLSGRTGLLVVVDNMDVMLERSPETGRFLYTPNAVKDTCELIRQLIDDAELLEHFVMLLSGRREVLTDERHGFASYEALWMRLQTGLAPTPHFNPWADIVDVDHHLEAAGGDALVEDVGRRLQQLLQKSGVKRKYRDDVKPPEASPLRLRVMETALMTELGGGN